MKVNIQNFLFEYQKNSNKFGKTKLGITGCVYIKELQVNKSNRLEENIAELQKNMSTQLGE